MTDDFSWWQNALEGQRGPIHDGEPQSGFYRQRNASKQYEAVAYWKDESSGAQRCHINGREANEQWALEKWPYISKNPITAESYWHFIDHRKWLDEDISA